MESAEQQNDSRDEKRRLHMFYLSIITVLGLLCIILTWQFFNQKTRIETIEKEKIVYLEKSNSLQAELADLKSDYEALKTSDSKLKAELDEKIKLIEELQLQAEKHKGDAYMIYKLEKEAETLRKIMKHFVQQIDSLGRLNKEIVAQKEKVESELSSEKDKTSQLTKEKEELQGTINLGSILKASNIKVSGVRYKSGGKKELETKTAKRVEKIKMTFTIGENKIAKKGDRTLYARIVTPDGKELAKSLDESNTFKFNGNKGYFAAKTTVSYNNEEMNVTFYTSKSDVEFLPGKYLIEITADEFVIGTTSLVLE
ncbi:MAG: hypothetical protein AB1458_01290 [Bacteroidota bacterium]